MRHLREVRADEIAWGADDDRLPHIDVRGRDPVQVTEETIAALQRANDPPVLFRFAGVPSRVEASADGPEPSIVPLDLWRLRYHAQRAARYTRPGRNGTETLIAAPLDVMRDILAAPAWPFPVLHRIVQAPVFASDGTLCARPGYHPAGIYYAPYEDFHVPLPALQPTGADITTAVALIDELMRDFPIVDDASRAHLFAMFLQPFVRDLIDGPTPLYCLTKPAPGTGASLLAEMLMWPAIGESPAQIAVGHQQEDEIQKALTATLRGSPAAILLDNVVALTSPVLASVLTTWPSWDNRELGTSQMLRLPIRTTWIATANNPAMSDDLNRRCIFIRLDSGLEHPEDRTDFQHPDLREWVRDRRSDLVHAALVIAQQWISAGRPPGARTIGSYESWARTIGGILGQAGITGFLGNYASERAATGDPVSSLWHAFFEKWVEAHGSTPVTAADLWPLTSDLDLGEGSARSQQIRFGKALMRQRDRIFSGYRMTPAGEFRRAQIWRLVPVNV